MSPDAEPASILKHAAARAVKNAERTILGEHIDNLPRTAGYAYFNVVRHMLSFEIERYCADIAVRRVGARANQTCLHHGGYVILGNLLCHFADRRGGIGCERSVEVGRETAQVNFNHFVKEVCR